MDEAVTAEEPIGDDRDDPLVNGFASGPLPGDRLGALGGIGLRERRGVHDQPADFAGRERSFRDDVSAQIG
jgi:hypothetical protein